MIEHMTDAQIWQYDRACRAHGSYTVVDNLEKKEFFFSIDHCQTFHSDTTLDDNWVPISFSLPMHVVPRPGLEDGLVDTIEKYIQIFHSDSKEIPNPNPRYTPSFRKYFFEGNQTK